MNRKAHARKTWDESEYTPEDIKEKVWPLPATELLYVGRATTRKFANYGIHTIGDIASSDPAFLKRLLGVNGLTLWRYASGLDDSRVMHKDFVSPVKSIGHGITCNADLNNNEEVWKVILALAHDIGHRLRVHELEAYGVQISVRSNDLSGQQYQCRLPHATRSPMILARKARELFEVRYTWLSPVRTLTIRAINLAPQGQPQQSDLFTDFVQLDRLDRLETAVEDIRRRFGKKSVYSVCLMGDLKMPDDGRDEVVMPGMMFG